MNNLRLTLALLSLVLLPFTSCKEEDEVINFIKNIYINECSEDFIMTAAFVITNEEGNPDTLYAYSIQLNRGEQKTQSRDLRVLQATNEREVMLMQDHLLNYSFEFKDSIVQLLALNPNGKSFPIFDTWYDDATYKPIGTIVSTTVKADTAINTYTFTDEYIRQVIKLAEEQGVFPIRKQ